MFNWFLFFVTCIFLLYHEPFDIQNNFQRFVLPKSYSRACALPSLGLSLTSLFGMGRGVTSSMNQENKKFENATLVPPFWRLQVVYINLCLV